jgi:adenosylcobinamide kinase/adenosylcobinamide-phosphate guanylyltransferase
MNPRRLTAEEIVDAMLSASGELGSQKRALYRSVRRNTPDPQLGLFDFPDRIRSKGQRHQTTSSTQALMLLNNDWAHDRAAAMADQLAGTNDDDLIHSTYRQLFYRDASVEELAAAHGTRIYVATGAAGDAEMEERIALHRARRGPAWQTVEEPLDLAGALKRHDAEGTYLLVDCVTLWLSNLMAAEQDTEAAVAELAGALQGLRGTVALVSNEVGLGIVPENALARRFRDIAGRTNQRLAQACDQVILVAAGLPLVLKGPPLAN